jgi:hypothetical protein
MTGLGKTLKAQHVLLLIVLTVGVGLELAGRAVIGTELIAVSVVKLLMFGPKEK